MKEWQEFVEKAKKPKATIEIGLCGKYVAMPDAYKSVIEGITHAATAQNLHANIRWIEAELLKHVSALPQAVQGLSGLIVPGGFGIRGMEGKTEAIGYVRENRDYRFLGYALDYNVRWLNLPVMLWAWKVQTLPNSTPTLNIQLSISCPANVV